MKKSKNAPIIPINGYDVEYKFFSFGISQLEGKMLTLIEASIQDTEQRKALKDIVRQTIWGWAIENNCNGDGRAVQVPRG
jgi:hypothetical protein